MDETTCPHCGLTNPGAPWKRSFAIRLLSNPYDLITIIIAVNGAFYLLSILLNPTSLGFSSSPFTFLSPSNRSLLILGATGTLPIDQFHRWWTLLSASYLHGGLLHIVFNMIALHQLAPFVITEYGMNRFAIIYTITGIAGFFTSYVAGVSFTIGASAAVCGLIGAILYYGKSRGGSYGEAIYKQTMGWIVGLVLFGLFFPGINNWAHGGGLVAGIGSGFLLGYGEKKRETLTHRSLAWGCMGLTVTLLGWAVLQALYIRFM
jgi:rhomboid protease GluP